MAGFKLAITVPVKVIILKQCQAINHTNQNDKMLFIVSGEQELSTSKTFKGAQIFIWMQQYALWGYNTEIITVIRMF